MTLQQVIVLDLEMQQPPSSITNSQACPGIIMFGIGFAAIVEGSCDASVCNWYEPCVNESNNYLKK